MSLQLVDGTEQGVLENNLEKIVEWLRDTGSKSAVNNVMDYYYIAYKLNIQRHLN